MEKNLSAKLTRIPIVGFYILALLTTGTLLVIGVIGTRIYSGTRLVLFLTFTFIAAAAAFLCIRFKESLTDKKLLFIGILCFAALALLQVESAFMLAQNPAWDMGGVYTSALEWVTENKIVTHMNYFDRFPNNAGLFVIEAVFFRLLNLFGAAPSLFLASLLNLLFTDLGILFMVLFVRKCWGNSRALFYLFISMCFLPYILYIPVIYTDTFSLPFVTLPLLLFAYSQKQDRKIFSTLMLIPISLILSFGAKVKGNVIILFIAFFVYMLCKYPLKQWLTAILTFIVPFFLFSSLFDTAVLNDGIVTQYSDIYKYPASSWIYMGLKSPGGYNGEDSTYIHSFPNYQSKQDAANYGIKQRLSEYGISGFAGHIFKKAKYTFGEGTYFAGVKLGKDPVNPDNGWYSHFSYDGTKNSLYYDFSNAMQAAVLLLLIAGLVMGLFKKSFDMSSLLYMAFFGLSIFLMIWETRSRYLINFSPIMLALADDSLFKLLNSCRYLFYSKNNAHEIQVNEFSQVQNSADSINSNH